METLTTDVAIIGGGPSGEYLRRASSKSTARGRGCSSWSASEFPRDHIGESQLPADRAHSGRVGRLGPRGGGGLSHQGRRHLPLGHHRRPVGLRFPALRAVRRRAPARDGTRVNVHADRVPSRPGRLRQDPAGLRPGAWMRRATARRRFARCGVRATASTVWSCPTARRSRRSGTIDATGHAGLLRRAMGVAVEEPSALKNVAGLGLLAQRGVGGVAWGSEGTRIQILSLGYGWIWFIPIGPGPYFDRVRVPCRVLQEVRPLDGGALRATPSSEEPRDSSG